MDKETKRLAKLIGDALAPTHKIRKDKGERCKRIQDARTAKDGAQRLNRRPGKSLANTRTALEKAVPPTGGIPFLSNPGMSGKGYTRSTPISAKNFQIKKIDSATLAELKDRAAKELDIELPKRLEHIVKILRASSDPESVTYRPELALRAIENLNKIFGDYAPTKTESQNLNVNVSQTTVDLIKHYERDY